MWWALAAPVRTDGPCDCTAALDGSLELTTSPLLVSIRFLSLLFDYARRVVLVRSKGHVLDLAGHNQTTNLDAGRLDGRFESHHRLGVWAKRLGMTQEARVAKGHKLPTVVSCQRV